MDPSLEDPRSPDIARRQIDRELRLADDALALLRSGRFTRVIVGGLRFGDALLPEVRRRARGTDITVTPLPGIDDGPADLLFQRTGVA
jgi:hypothetical protein